MCNFSLELFWNLLILFEIELFETIHIKFILYMEYIIYNRNS